LLIGHGDLPAGADAHAVGIAKARGDDFRNAIADALYEAVARFRAAAIEKPAP